MKVCLVPSDMDAPGFYRLLSPGRQLAQNGHTVVMPEHRRIPKENGAFTTEFTIQVAPPDPQADVWVLQQRKEREWADNWVHHLRGHGVVTVADIDDNYEELPHWNPAWLGTHPYVRTDGVIVNRAERRRIKKDTGIAAPNKSNREHMKRVFDQVDGLTCSTPYLEHLYGHLAPRCEVIRNYVDWDIWEDIQPQYEAERDRLRIGYLGVWRYRAGDLEVIKDVIAPVLARWPHVDFVANSKEVHDFLNIPHAQRVIEPEYHFFPYDGGDYPLGRKTAVLDIGLVPLAMGGMAEAKSHLKGMEYNAAGIPFVASNTESYRYWCDEDNGQIAKVRKDWAELLNWYIEDDTMRRAHGENGRRKAKAHSIQRNWRRYEEFYGKLIGDDLTVYARGAIVRGAVQKVSELRALLELVTTIGPVKTVVEVGSARGGTFWALAQVADDDALMVSIDIPAGSPLDIRDGVDVYDGRNRELFHYFKKESQRCKLIDGDSQSLDTFNKLVDTIGHNKVDVLFIDADHRYQGVKRDYELYRPLVRKGGVIAFHDVIRQNDLRSGVHVLWAELQKKHATQEWVGRDNWGLGSWGGIGAILV